MNNFKYPLVKDTISKHDLKDLSAWVKNTDRLTKGILNNEFESQWSIWNGSANSVFVNSGSSANLLMLYAEQLIRKSTKLKIIAPAVSWVTTIAPAIQLGMEVYLCDCDDKNLGIDINHLEYLFKKHRPDILILVHVLGHINDMSNINYLCKKYNVTLFEDCCESPGTEKNKIKVGNYGKAGSFSFYYGHHISTIEGGMVVTKDKEFCQVMKSIRSHGWSRDLLPENQVKLKEKR